MCAIERSIEAWSFSRSASLIHHRPTDRRLPGGVAISSRTDSSRARSCWRSCGERPSLKPTQAVSGGRSRGTLPHSVSQIRRRRIDGWERMTLQHRVIVERLHHRTLEVRGSIP